METLVVVNAALVGLFAFAAIHYAVKWWFSRDERELLFFSIQCGIYAVVCFVITSYFRSTTVPDAQARLDRIVTFGAITHTVVLHFYAVLAGRRDRVFRWGVTGMMAFVVVMSMLAPLRGTVLELQSAHLPWGGTGLVAILTPPGWPLALLYLGVLAAHLYGLFVAATVWKRDRVGAVIIAAASLAILAGATIGILIDFAKVRAPYVGALPHAIFVLLMALYLARQHAARAARLVISERRTARALRESEESLADLKAEQRRREDAEAERLRAMEAVVEAQRLSQRSEAERLRAMEAVVEAHRLRQESEVERLRAMEAVVEAQQKELESQLAVGVAHEELRKAHDELSKLKNQLEAENLYLQQELRQGEAFGGIVGDSQALKSVHFKVSQVASTDTTVLIEGETGTGKELVAHAIHQASGRSDRPLIKVNCAALSPTLIESELFGHERGAFTGAAGRKLGRFELANTGTILLDEIGELPLDLQSKLLRVLQESELERVGGSKTIKIDVRVLAATNRDLKRAVEKGTFREDLWYRLNVFPISIPPLRDRRDDIPLLTEHFARSFARKFGKDLTGISPETLNALCAYSWPGNVRELANVIERAIINLRGTVLKINEEFQMWNIAPAPVQTLEQMERKHILQALEDLNWRIDGPKGAARVLGLNPSTLRTRMGKLGITKPNGRPVPTSSE